MGASEGLLYAAQVTMGSVKKIDILGPASCHVCSNFGKHSHKWFHSLVFYVMYGISLEL